MPVQRTLPRFCLTVAAVAVSISITTPLRADERGSLPTVHILATGGTIAGVASDNDKTEYTAGKLGVETLIKAVPQLREIADVHGEQIVNIASQDMTDEIWLRLARRVNDLLKSADVAGVVITHGTDTLEETAYFLHLTIHSRKPVVLVGAMRPANGLSADGPMNLLNAVAVAADPQARDRGVLVVMNDRIFGGRDVTKTNTTNAAAFDSRDRGPLGRVLSGHAQFFATPEEVHTTESFFDVEKVSELPQVEILYAYAGMPPELVQAVVTRGVKGVVIAGTGNGNVSRPVLDVLARAAQRDVLIVRSTRTGSGFVGRNVEIDDDALGFVAAGDLNPQKARVLLKLALLKTGTLGEVQDLFFAY